MDRVFLAAGRCSFDRLIRKGERSLDEPSNYLPGRVYIFTGGGRPPRRLLPPASRQKFPPRTGMAGSALVRARGKLLPAVAFRSSRFYSSLSSTMKLVWLEKRKLDEKIEKITVFELSTEEEDLISIRFDSLCLAKN